MSEEMLRSYEELRAEFSTACAELEKERERREKAEAVVRYYEELLVSPFDPRILALDDGGHAKIPSPQRVRDILSENARMRDALEWYANKKNWESPSTGFALQYDPELSPVRDDCGKLARAALKPAGGES